MVKVIICGGREFFDKAKLYKVMDEFHSKTPVTTVVSGCAMGADNLGEWWASDRKITVERYPADWKFYGKKAGPIRNGEMARSGATHCVAFPGGSGTRDMIRQAKENSLYVLEIVK